MDVYSILDYQVRNGLQFYTAFFENETVKIVKYLNSGFHTEWF